MVTLLLRRKSAMSQQASLMIPHERSSLITLEGRLDSNTYLDFEERIRSVLTGSPRLLIFDLEELEYISSMEIWSFNTVQEAVDHMIAA
jgi:anti-anti-sigma regulatory factor